jgi:LmbE family N-acetylglucosaminyl deacetylase
LFIAAHPDDEVLGAGGTIQAHHACGDETTVLYVTDGFFSEPNDQLIAEKRDCARAAGEVLGIDNQVFLGCPGMRLDTWSGAALAALFTDTIADLHPSIVYTQFGGDLNSDHRIVFQSTMVACRPHRGEVIARILAYETLSSTEWGGLHYAETFVPSCFVTLNGEQIERKQRAFECYPSEVFEFPHPRSREGIEYQARLRGATVRAEYAESFVVVRDVLQSCDL